MLGSPGFFAVDELTAAKIMLDAQSDGKRVFCFPRHISSKAQFFDGVRAAFPLDPPLHGYHSWDALADSLWSGLEGLQEEDIVIVWRDSRHMQMQAEEDFAIALDILHDLPGALADVALTVNQPKKLLVLQVV
ncbi:barstar family protein [Janthinobacterium sp.]|uniref:barstar family protein n=1 Tax=Janthinobacterium sp. TaxID=1871054 RepID=UPI00258FF7C4|nr:barstar family protein [Janthinobacterium sp.]MCX7290471.1 barstar family protein [Janthinobacterium sp.]